MKDIWSVIRIALSVMALPLLATAAVSALNNNDGSAVVTENVLALRAASAKAPDASFRHHMISVDAEGVVRGRVARTQDSGEVVGLGEMRISFIQEGNTISQAYSRADGSFEVVGLVPGGYSFVASGDNGFAAFGVKVSDNPNDETNNLMEVGTVNPNYDRLIDIVGSRLSQVTVVNEVADFAPPRGGNHVQIVDGRIRGNLTELNGTVENGKVFLIRNQTVVTAAISGEKGEFVFEGVEPGVYEFVAMAQEGFAAFSFVAGSSVSILSLDESSLDGSDEYRFVSTNSGEVVAETAPIAYQDTLDATLVNPGDQVNIYDSIIIVNPAPEVLPPDTYVGEELAYGMANGGYGTYGGGGGGGFGDLASFGRAAIMGWVLVELFDNIDFSNNNNTQPPPSSPSS